MENEKILLNVEETATYLNLGKTKTRVHSAEPSGLRCVSERTLCGA